MTPVVSQLPVVSSEDPVGVALNDPAVRAGLSVHALSILGRWLADRPVSVRAEAAADAVQETQLRAFQKRCEFNSGLGTVPGWLHGIMNHVLTEMLRSLKQLPTQAPPDLADWEKLALDLSPQAAEAVPDRLAVADYLSQLPSHHTEVLRLRYFEDLSHDEIAVRLGISPANARVQLYRALVAAKAVAGVVRKEGQR